MSLASKGPFVAALDPQNQVLTAVNSYIVSKTMETSGYDEIILALTITTAGIANQSVGVIPVYQIVIPEAPTVDAYAPVTSLPTIETGGASGQLATSIVSGLNSENIFMGSTDTWGTYNTIRPIYVTPETDTPNFSTDIFFSFPVMNANKMRFVFFKKNGTGATSVYALTSLIRKF